MLLPLNRDIQLSVEHMQYIILKALSEQHTNNFIANLCAPFFFLKKERTLWVSQTSSTSYALGMRRDINVYIRRLSFL